MILVSLVIAIIFAISAKYIVVENFNIGLSGSKIVSSVFNFPEKISRYFITGEEVIQYSTIPKEVLVVYNDLEKRLNDKSTTQNNRTEEWRLTKVRETAMKYSISTDKVMELYVKVKNAK